MADRAARTLFVITKILFSQPFTRLMRSTNLFTTTTQMRHTRMAKNTSVDLPGAPLWVASVLQGVVVARHVLRQLGGLRLAGDAVAVSFRT